MLRLIEQWCIKHSQIILILATAIKVAWNEITIPKDLSLMLTTHRVYSRLRVPLWGLFVSWGQMMALTYILVRFHLVRWILSFWVTEIQSFVVFCFVFLGPVFLPQLFTVPSCVASSACSVGTWTVSSSMSLLRMWAKPRIKEKALYNLLQVVVWPLMIAVVTSVEPLMSSSNWYFLHPYFSVFYSPGLICLFIGLVVFFFQLIFIELILCGRQALLKAELLGFANRWDTECERKRCIRDDSKVLTWTTEERSCRCQDNLPNPDRSKGDAETLIVWIWTC